MTPLFRKFLSMNWPLVANMFALLIFGVICIYSAVHMRDESSITSSWNRQVLYIAIGTVVFFGASLIDFRWVLWGAVPMYLTGLTFLIMVLFVGTEIYGHKSWIELGPLRFQPSQPAVASSIILASVILGHLPKVAPLFRNPFVRLAAVGVVTGIPFLLVLVGGDFGSAIVLLPVVGAMLLVGSIPFRYLITIVLLGLFITPIAFFFGLKPNQKARITVYIDMLSGKSVDTQNEAYAAHNIIKAVGSGGFAGKGVDDKKSITNLGFIPKKTAHNDFIFAVLAETFGFQGSFLLLMGFAALLTQGLFIAYHCRDDDVGRLIAVGVVALFFSHTFQHVGMNILIMPITGIPLPFISYGGTFVVICMFLCGMLQSVWVHRPANRPKSGGNSFSMFGD